MKRKTHDWEALKTEFVTGDISAAALAKKHNISSATLYRRYQIERWNEARREYRESVMEKCTDNAAYLAAIKLAKEIDIADKLSDVLEEAVNDEKQFYRYIVKEKNGTDSTDEERIFGKMDMQAFNNAIKALDSLQEIKRVMHGIMNVSGEEEKSGASEEPGESGVVILPEIKE